MPKIIAVVVVLAALALAAWNFLPGDSSWQYYESEKYGLAFYYPSNFIVKENDGGAIINVTPKDEAQARADALLPIKFYLRDYSADMPDFTSAMADTQGYVEAKVSRISGEESTFDQEEINGIPVVLHKRNILGLIGNVYELYADWNGQFLTISSEAPTAIVDRLYRSLKKI